MTNYFLGLDLGQSVDHTALAVLESSAPAAPDADTELDADGDGPAPAAAVERDWQTFRPAAAVVSAPPRPLGRTARRYALRALKRWPLGTPYPAIVEDVKKIVSTPPLLQTLDTDVVGQTVTRRPALAIDASGCGRPVTDAFRAAGLTARLSPVVITAGLAESFDKGFHHVAKAVLISGVQVLLMQRRLQFSPKLPEAATLLKEFQEYRVKVTPAANEVFNARDGAHDDIVLAVALACWLGERCNLRLGAV